MEKIVTLAILSCILGLSAAAEWFETASFYQIYPQTFFDDGSSGNGRIKGFGSLKGVEAKLDYIKELGIDCVWLTPVFESEKFNAFGYDITNYTNIDRRYGNLDDFKQLVTAVHAKNMKIVVDFVPNHCGVDHPFFQASVKNEDEKGDWFVWTSTERADINPSNWQRIGGGIGSAWNFVEDKVKPVDPENAYFYYAQFSGNMPDWNLRNDEVKAYMKDVLKFWMDAGVDGFRIDAISHSYEALPPSGEGKTYHDIDEEVNPDVTDPNSFEFLNHTYTQDQPETFQLVYDWREFIDKYCDEKNISKKVIMTESYSQPDVIKQFYRDRDGSKLGAHLPFNFNMITKLNRNSTAADIVKTISDWMKEIPDGHITNWVIGNHDNSRVATRFGEDRVDIMNVLVTMLRGTSMTYYGEEIGMSDSCAVYADNHDDPARACATDAERARVSDAAYRSPMQWSDEKNAGFTNESNPWIPVNANYKTVNVKAQQGNDKSHLEIYRSLLKLRKEHHALMHDEKFEIKALGTNSFGFIRHINDVKKQSVFVAINFGAAVEKVKIRENFDGTSSPMTVEIASGKSKHSRGIQLAVDGEIQLEGYEALVMFYNSSMTLAISKLILILSILAHRLFFV